MKNTLIGPETGRMEGFHLVQFLDSFLDIPGRSPGHLQSTALGNGSKDGSEVRAARRREISDLGFSSDRSANPGTGQGMAQVYPVLERVQRRPMLSESGDLVSLRRFHHSRRENPAGYSWVWSRTVTAWRQWGGAKVMHPCQAWSGTECYTVVGMPQWTSAFQTPKSFSDVKSHRDRPNRLTETVSKAVGGCSVSNALTGAVLSHLWKRGGSAPFSQTGNSRFASTKRVRLVTLAGTGKSGPKSDPASPLNPSDQRYLNPRNPGYLPVPVQRLFNGRAR